MRFLSHMLNIHRQQLLLYIKCWPNMASIPFIPFRYTKDECMAWRPEAYLLLCSLEAVHFFSLAWIFLNFFRVNPGCKIHRLESQSVRKWVQTWFPCLTQLKLFYEMRLSHISNWTVGPHILLNNNLVTLFFPVVIHTGRCGTLIQLPAIPL